MDTAFPYRCQNLPRHRISQIVLPDTASPAISLMAMMKAKEDAIAGKGPSLVEIKTCRYRGHWTGDPEPYRTREEVNKWKERDAIDHFAKEIVEREWATMEELEKIKADTIEEMEKAAEFALNSPDPDPAHLMDDVFYEGD